MPFFSKSEKAQYAPVTLQVLHRQIQERFDAKRSSDYETADAIRDELEEKYSVKIDGHDLRDVTMSSLRSQLGIVLQDTFLFGGTIQEIPQRRMDRLVTQRDPAPKNGIAAQLFVSDILASQLDGNDELLLDLESSEKDLVLINERLQLRGAEIDNLIVDAMSDRFEKDENALNVLRTMTLTVVDGDFPREVLASQNLGFDAFTMAAQMNTPLQYDAKTHGPANVREGRLYLGAIDRNSDASTTVASRSARPRSNIALFSIPGVALLMAFCVFGITRTSANANSRR